MSGPRRARTALSIAALALLSDPASAQDTIRVLSYNIRHGVGMDMQLDLERVAAVIRSLDPDVVLLQEVDLHTQRTRQTDQADVLSRLTDLPHYAFGSFMEYDGGQYGMAVLSAAPILDFRNHRLPDGEEPRTTLAARIRPAPDATEIVFAGIHLYRTEAERLAQATELVEIFATEVAPVVLVGDFNSQLDDPVMRLLGASWWTPPKPDGARLTWPADEPRVEIDHVLYRPERRFAVAEYRVVEEPTASDHRPVLIVLVVTR